MNTFAVHHSPSYHHMHRFPLNNKLRARDYLDLALFYFFFPFIRNVHDVMGYRAVYSLVKWKSPTTEFFMIFAWTLPRWSFQRLTTRVPARVGVQNISSKSACGHPSLDRSPPFSFRSISFILVLFSHLRWSRFFLFFSPIKSLFFCSRPSFSLISRSLSKNPQLLHSIINEGIKIFLKK